MKVAILAKSICLITPKIANHLKQNNIDIECVIIEKNYRKKYSKAEIQHREALDRLNKETNKYSLIRRMTKQIYKHFPTNIKARIEQNIYHIPLANKFSTRKFCVKNNIPFFEVKKHSSAASAQIIQERGLDYVLNGSTNWLLKDPTLSLPQVKFINAHPGWLPKHKGLDSIRWSILEGDPVGITTHYIDHGIDTGDILKFYEVDLSDATSLNHVWRKVMQKKVESFTDTLLGLEKGSIQTTKQEGNYPAHRPMTYEEHLEVYKIINKLA
jgi:folate-dependent phosphoribosylglycinamide formyltransferase PurN